MGPKGPKGGIHCNLCYWLIMSIQYSETTHNKIALRARFPVGDALECLLLLTLCTVNSEHTHDQWSHAHAKLYTAQLEHSIWVSQNLILIAITIDLQTLPMYMQYKVGIGGLFRRGDSSQGSQFMLLGNIQHPETTLKKNSALRAKLLVADSLEFLLLWTHPWSHNTHACWTL